MYCHLLARCCTRLLPRAKMRVTRGYKNKRNLGKRKKTLMHCKLALRVSPEYTPEAHWSKWSILRPRRSCRRAPPRPTRSDLRRTQRCEGVTDGVRERANCRVSVCLCDNVAPRPLLRHSRVQHPAGNKDVELFWEYHFTAQRGDSRTHEDESCRNSCRFPEPRASLFVLFIRTSPCSDEYEYSSTLNAQSASDAPRLRRPRGESWWKWCSIPPPPAQRLENTKTCPRN